MTEAGGRVALVAGGSGLVGSALLGLLLRATEYGRVCALSRRPLPLEHARLANRVLRFDAPLGPQLTGLKCQDAFCCLGTTLRTAGGEAGFRTIDHDLVIAFARTARSLGAECCVLVSAVGADSGSRNLYLRVKGEVEQALEALRFRSLHLLQPSLLLGARRERRPLELLAQPLMLGLAPLLLGPLSRYRPIGSDLVAAAMLACARGHRLGVYRYTYQQLRRLASTQSGSSPL